jgi:hypothetical protein
MPASFVGRAKVTQQQPKGQRAKGRGKVRGERGEGEAREKKERR